MKIYVLGICNTENNNCSFPLNELFGWCILPKSCIYLHCVGAEPNLLYKSVDKCHVSLHALTNDRQNHIYWWINLIFVSIKMDVLLGLLFKNSIKFTVYETFTTKVKLNSFFLRLTTAYSKMLKKSQVFQFFSCNLPFISSDLIRKHRYDILLHIICRDSFDVTIFRDSVPS